jgi:hypothetical protein
VKRAGRDGDPAGGAANPERASRLIKRTDVARAPVSLRDAGESRNRQPVKGSIELPQPTALARRAARRAPGREPDFAIWGRLTPAQRRQSKWRAEATEWQREAVMKAEFIAALVGLDRPEGLSFSVDEAVLSAAGELIRALRSSVDPHSVEAGRTPLLGWGTFAPMPDIKEMPVTTGLFAPADDEETPPASARAGSTPRGVA